MKYLQSFSVFESQTSATLTPDQESFLNQYARNAWSVNPATGLVDVKSSFDCSNRELKSLCGIRFGTVKGDFYCFNNQLTTLEGAPRKVEGYFYCSVNQLTTLEGAPQTVGGDFFCSSNQLTTLTGAPQTVGGNFWCYNNKLTTLEGAPETVGGNFWCYNNRLTNLVGAPQTVEGDFDCEINQLSTLEGAPETVQKTFLCDAFELEPGKWNPTGWLEVLRTGSPEAQNLISSIIGADYWNSEISSNPVGTLLRLAAVWDGLPENVKGKIRIPSNLQDDFDNFLDLERAGIF
jgi:hypothetical protein